jgi:hypothetical protein
MKSISCLNIQQRKFLEFGIIGTIDIIRLYWRTRNKEILNIMKGQIQIGNFKSQSPLKAGWRGGTLTPLIGALALVKWRGVKIIFCFVEYNERTSIDIPIFLSVYSMNLASKEPLISVVWI